MKQPTLSELSYLGEPDLFSAIRHLCLDKSSFTENKELLEQLSNFQVFMQVINQPEAIEKKNIIISLLDILFPDYNVSMTPNSILLMPSQVGGKPVMIDSNTFPVLQDIVKQVFCANTLFFHNNVVYNPSGKLAEKIAQRLYETRRMKEERQQASGKNKTSCLLGQYMSLLSVGIHIPITEISKYTLHQLIDQVERFTLRENWNVDFQIRLTGTKPEKEVENWMKDIYN